MLTMRLSKAGMLLTQFAMKQEVKTRRMCSTLSLHRAKRAGSKSFVDHDHAVCSRKSTRNSTTRRPI